jgi:hypothetical protein
MFQIIYFSKSNTTVLLGNFYSPDTLNAYTSSQNFGMDVNNRVKSSYNYRSNFLSNNFLQVIS